MTGKRIRRMVDRSTGSICVIHVQYESGEVERLTFVKEDKTA